MSVCWLFFFSAPHFHNCVVYLFVCVNFAIETTHVFRSSKTHKWKNRYICFSVAAKSTLVDSVVFVNVYIWRKKKNWKKWNACIETRLDLQRSLLMQLVIYTFIFELLTPETLQLNWKLYTILNGFILLLYLI